MGLKMTAHSSRAEVFVGSGSLDYGYYHDLVQGPGAAVSSPAHRFERPLQNSDLASHRRDN